MRTCGHLGSKYKIIPKNIKEYISLGLIREHIKGHTKCALNYTHVCKDCLWEIMMDSIWDTGFMPRLSFIKNLENRYYAGDIAVSETEINEIISSSYQSLSCICPGCNKPTEPENTKKKWFPDKIVAQPQFKKIQRKFLKDNDFPPYYIRIYYSWLWCKKCTTKIELSYLKGIKDKNLPLLINQEWITNKAYLEYIRRITEAKI